jgi:hypothetical protein
MIDNVSELREALIKSYHLAVEKNLLLQKVAKNNF